MISNTRPAGHEVRELPFPANLFVLSIVVGLATTVAVIFASEKAAKTVAVKTKFEIVAPDHEGLNENLAGEIRKLPDVEIVEPLVKWNTILYLGKEKQYRLVALGIDPANDQQICGYEITKGKMISDETGGVMLDEVCCKKADINLNEPIEFLTKRGIVKAKVVAFYKLRGTVATAEGSPMLMSLMPAQYFLKTPHEVGSVQFVLKPGADHKAALAAIERILPAGASVREVGAPAGDALKLRRPAKHAGSRK